MPKRTDREQRGPGKPQAIDWLSHPVTENGEGYLLLKSPAGAVLRISNEERCRIVRAVNLHDELVAALEAIDRGEHQPGCNESVGIHDYCPCTIEIARAALAKAKGG